jgi:chemotaxis protein histidine kinase CheA
MFSLDAMDMMARAARAEAEAAEAKARAEREVVRLRAEAEAARAESRHFRLSAQEVQDAKARAEAEAKALFEAEMARQQAAFDAVRQKVEAEVRARAEAELARVRAEAEAARKVAEVEIRARAELEARAAVERKELEHLRAESMRFPLPTASTTSPMAGGRPTLGSLPAQPDPFAAVAAHGTAPMAGTSAATAPKPANTAAGPAPTVTMPAASVPPPATSTTPQPPGAAAAAAAAGPRGGARLMPGSQRTTPPNAAYRFNLGDNVILVLSSDNLRGETLCTSARLVGIDENGSLTVDSVDAISASRWDQKTVMIGKNPHNGSLLVAETRILSIEDTDFNTVHLSTTSGNLTTVQLRSSVRQRAIPEVQTFTRFDGGTARLIDYSIGGVGLGVPRNDARKRGDIIVGTLQLKRTLAFEVTLEVRGRERLVDWPDEDLLNCRFSTREMDPEVLRKISMAVLYRR